MMLRSGFAKAVPHIRAVLLLPTMATIVIPSIILYSTRSLRLCWGLRGRTALLPAMLGGTLLTLGLALLAWTIGLFATVGKGTLAPWEPTRRLVVRGPYRHVRNPMITGVLSILLGEAAVLGSPSLLAWSAVFFSANAAYIPLVEERGLERRFGDEYRVYKRSVPRWVPRTKAWDSQPGLDATSARPAPMTCVREA